VGSEEWRMPMSFMIAVLILVSNLSMRASVPPN
jgi:hypothetical protein